jgi:hypothetical protein
VPQYKEKLKLVSKIDVTVNVIISFVVAMIILVVMVMFLMKYTTLVLYFAQQKRISVEKVPCC